MARCWQSHVSRNVTYCVNLFILTYENTKIIVEFKLVDYEFVGLSKNSFDFHWFSVGFYLFTQVDGKTAAILFYSFLNVAF